MATTKYALVNTAAKMPGSCWGKQAYRNLGIVRVAEGYQPSDCTALDTRRKAVEEIVRAHYGVHVGETKRSAGYRLLTSLQAEVDRLNALEAVLEAACRRHR